jgi:hypothetical protein
LVDRENHGVEKNAVESLAWRWKQGVPPKFWHLSTKLLDVTSHKVEDIKSDNHFLSLQKTDTEAKCGGQIRPYSSGWE